MRSCIALILTASLTAAEPMPALTLAVPAGEGSPLIVPLRAQLTTGDTWLRADVSGRPRQQFGHEPQLALAAGAPLTVTAVEVASWPGAVLDGAVLRVGDARALDQAPPTAAAWTLHAAALIDTITDIPEPLALVIRSVVLDAQRTSDGWRIGTSAPAMLFAPVDPALTALLPAASQGVAAVALRGATIQRIIGFAGGLDLTNEELAGIADATLAGALLPDDQWIVIVPSSLAQLLGGRIAKDLDESLVHRSLPSGELVIASSAESAALVGGPGIAPLPAACGLQLRGEPALIARVGTAEHPVGAFLRKRLGAAADAWISALSASPLAFAGRDDAGTLVADANDQLGWTMAAVLLQGVHDILSDQHGRVRLREAIKPYDYDAWAASLARPSAELLPQVEAMFQALDKFAQLTEQDVLHPLLHERISPTTDVRKIDRLTPAQSAAVDELLEATLFMDEPGAGIAGFLVDQGRAQDRQGFGMDTRHFQTSQSLGRLASALAVRNDPRADYLMMRAHLLSRSMPDCLMRKLVSMAIIGRYQGAALRAALSNRDMKLPRFLPDNGGYWLGEARMVADMAKSWLEGRSSAWNRSPDALGSSLLPALFDISGLRQCFSMELADLVLMYGKLADNNLVSVPQDNEQLPFFTPARTTMTMVYQGVLRNDLQHALASSAFAAWRHRPDLPATDTITAAGVTIPLIIDRAFGGGIVLRPDPARWPEPPAGMTKAAWDKLLPTPEDLQREVRTQIGGGKLLIILDPDREIADPARPAPAPAPAPQVNPF